jgi:4-diphosphocytidyl-2-C-methyl-D-erythritol kinase
VFATGIGNVFHPVKLSLQGMHLVLVKPDIFVSTRAAFAHIVPKKPEVSLTEVVKLPVEQWQGVMKNDFEDSVFPQFPEIAAIKDRLLDLGAVYASMSGSGSSVYGLFRQAVPNVEEKFCGCFCRQRLLE